jgi:uncharacterized protein
MPSIPSNKPYRVGRSRTGLGLFATKPIKKGSKIIRYFGPLLDSKKKKDDAIENKYLFELNNRWTIDGSTRKNVARYINHACKPNAESDVKPRKRKVIIRAIKDIEPGEEINYDYGTDYFKAYLKPIGCKCAACEKKRKKQRAEARAEKARLKAKAERKELKKAEKLAREKAKAKAKLKDKAEREAKNALEVKPVRPKPVRAKSVRAKSVRPKVVRPKGLKAASVKSKSVKARPAKSNSAKDKTLKAKPGAAKSANGKHLNGNGRVKAARKKPAETPPIDMTLQAPAPAPVLQAEPAMLPEVSSTGLVH